MCSSSGACCFASVVERRLEMIEVVLVGDDVVREVDEGLHVARGDVEGRLDVRPDLADGLGMVVVEQ